MGTNRIGTTGSGLPAFYESRDSACVFVWGDENGLPIENPYFVAKSDPHVQAVLPAKEGCWFVCNAGHGHATIGRVRALRKDEHGWLMDYDTVLEMRDGVWHHYHPGIQIPLNVLLAMLPASHGKLSSERCVWQPAHYVNHPNAPAPFRTTVEH